MNFNKNRPMVKQNAHTSELWAFSLFHHNCTPSNPTKRNLINQQSNGLIMNLKRDCARWVPEKEEQNKFKASGQWDSWNFARWIFPLHWKRFTIISFFYLLYFINLQFSTWRLEKRQCKFQQTVLAFHRKPSTDLPHHSSRPRHARSPSPSAYLGGM